jgi:adenosylcobinamide-GDP ribazoletransferase
MWNSFIIAVQTMTRLTVQTEQAPTRVEARRAVFLFPLIGAMIGILTAAVWTVSSHIWTAQPLAPAALTLAVNLLFTGGRGFGGLARAGDGLAAQGGGGDRTRAFAIMRDPRRGTTGLIVLGAFLALKLAFLAALPSSTAWSALVIVGVMGGWASAFAYCAFPVAASGESGPGLAEAGPGEFLAATAVAVAGGAVMPTRGLLTLLAVAVVAGPTAQSVNRRLGGLNPPLCAALGEIAEIVALASLTVR